MSLRSDGWRATCEWDLLPGKRQSEEVSDLMEESWTISRRIGTGRIDHALCRDRRPALVSPVGEGDPALGEHLGQPVVGERR